MGGGGENILERKIRRKRKVKIEDENIKNVEEGIKRYRERKRKNMIKKCSGFIKIFRYKKFV